MFGPINKEWSIYLLSLPVLGVFWLLVQHEPVVLLTQNVFLIVAIVSIILYSMVYRKTEGSNTTAYVFAAVTIVAGIYTVLANLDHMPSFLPTSAAIAEYSLYVALALIVGFVIYGFMTHNSDELGRTVVLMILILTTVVFWALFEQSAGSMTLFADRVVDRELGAVTVTAAQFGSLNAGFIFLLALPFAWLWVWLAKRNMEPSTPVKFGLGIIQVGLGFGALVIGAEFPDAAGKVAMIWLVLAYLLHTTGELVSVTGGAVGGHQAIDRSSRRCQHGYLVPGNRIIRNRRHAPRQDGGHSNRRRRGDEFCRCAGYLHAALRIPDVRRPRCWRLCTAYLATIETRYAWRALEPQKNRKQP